MFHAREVSLQLVRALRAPLAAVQQHDRSLADQLRRAAASVPLNVAEGSRRIGKDRLHSYRVAAGSADEVRTALQVAEAFGYVARAEVQPALDLVDRVCALLWRLTHPRP